MKSHCSRCFRHRPCKIVAGPGLHPKGEEICRACEKAVKLAEWEKLKAREREDPVESAA